jgi:secreted protein with Ig-like and vWFA domain
MKVTTLIFNNGMSLNRVFNINGLLIPRFGNDTQGALRFKNDADAQAVLDTLDLNMRNTCSLQHFVF